MTCPGVWATRCIPWCLPAARAFWGCWVDGYEPLVPAMGNYSKGRHVLAAAVRTGAQTIVTFNLRDLQPKRLHPGKLRRKALTLSWSTSSISIPLWFSLSSRGRPTSEAGWSGCLPSTQRQCRFYGACTRSAPLVSSPGRMAEDIIMRGTESLGSVFYRNARAPKRGQSRLHAECTWSKVNVRKTNKTKRKKFLQFREPLRTMVSFRNVVVPACAACMAWES